MTALDTIIDQHADRLSEAGVLQSHEAIVKINEIADDICKLEIKKLFMSLNREASYDPAKFLSLIEAL